MNPLQTLGTRSYTLPVRPGAGAARARPLPRPLPRPRSWRFEVVDGSGSQGRVICRAPYRDWARLKLMVRFPRGEGFRVRFLGPVADGSEAVDIDAADMTQQDADNLARRIIRAAGSSTGGRMGPGRRERA